MAEENQNINSEEAKKYAKEMGRAASNVDKLQTSIGKLTDPSAKLGQNFQVFADHVDDLTASLRDSKDVMKQIEEGQMSLNDATKLQTKYKEDQAKLDRTADQLSKQLLGKKSKLSDKEKATVKAQIDGIKKAAGTQNKNMDEAVKKAAKGETFLAKGFDKLGEKFKGIGLGTAGDKLKGMGAQARKTAIAGGGMVKQFASAFGIMKKIRMLNPFGLILSAITFVFKTLMEVNQQTTELGRSLGVSGVRAAEVRKHFQNVANDVRMAGIEVGEVLKAQNDLNSSLGLSVTMIHTDLIGGMAVLTERFKVSAEAATNLAKSALATGTSVTDMRQEIQRGTLAMEKQLGVNIAANDVLEKAASTTGEVRAMFFQMPGALGEAVARAQTLGRTLGEVRDQSRGFLDFQSSITKEFEAELFLGRQLNLDKLRLASLTGDLATVQEETVKQAGSFLEFTQMSTMERMKLADALNMNVDALSDMLLAQTNLDELRGSMEERDLAALEASQKQLSIQEMFNAAIKRLKNMVINLVAKLDSIPFLKNLTEIGDDMIGNFRGGQQNISNYNPAGGANREFDEFQIKAEDFTIKTHPADTLLMAGGTKLGNNNNGISSEHIMELIEVSKRNRVFSYDGFAAVKEAGHYGTKFS